MKVLQVLLQTCTEHLMAAASMHALTSLCWQYPHEVGMVLISCVIFATCITAWGGWEVTVLLQMVKWFCVRLIWAMIPRDLYS